MESTFAPVRWLPLIPLIPLLGFVVNGLLGPRLGKRFVTIIGIGAPLAAFTLALAATIGLARYDQSAAVRNNNMRRVLELSALPVRDTSSPRVVVVPGQSVDIVRGVIGRAALPGITVSTAGE